MYLVDRFPRRMLVYDPADPAVFTGAPVGGKFVRPEKFVAADAGEAGEGSFPETAPFFGGGGGIAGAKESKSRCRNMRFRRII